MATTTPNLPLQMPTASLPPYTAHSGAPQTTPTSQQPDLSHGPKVRFYDRLKINWKFGMTNYALVERPSADTAPALYRFGKPIEPTREMLHNLVFGVTQGLSKNVYKLYVITVVFSNMTHNEAVDYCARHSGLERFGNYLSRTDQHEIKGHLLELDLETLESHFKHVLFGVCTGMMESRYLLVLSKKPVNKADFASLVHEMEVACAKSDLAAGNHIDEAKEKIQHVISRFASGRT